ncbi:MAG: hypothetical protein KA248_15590 [Kiritimatiellae bacterium]|nr:hypothetical protein [Kiritimatiellia bacterium]
MIEEVPSGLMEDSRSTRTKLLQKLLALVPIERIRPTNLPDPHAEIRNIRYSPIVLVLADDQFCYIVDGNHRFYQKLQLREFSNSIAAWILEAGDEDKLYGSPLPQPLQDWRDGLISYQQLCHSAQLAWQSTMSQLNVEIPSRHNQKYDGIVQSGSSHEATGKRDSRALDRAQTVLLILSGKTTLHTAARQLNVSVKDIGLWQKIFIDGGIRALKEQLDKTDTKDQKLPADIIVVKDTSRTDRMITLIPPTPSTNLSTQTTTTRKTQVRQTRGSGTGATSIRNRDPVRHLTEYRGKYRHLADYLKVDGRPEIILTFDQIEAILGFNLPETARTNHTWWANSLTRTNCFGWLGAGYKVAYVKTGYNGRVNFKVESE